MDREATLNERVILYEALIASGIDGNEIDAGWDFTVEAGELTYERYGRTFTLAVRELGEVGSR